MFGYNENMKYTENIFFIYLLMKLLNKFRDIKLHISMIYKPLLNLSILNEQFNFF